MSLIYWKGFYTLILLQIKSHTDWLTLGRSNYYWSYVGASVDSVRAVLVMYDTILVCLIFLGVITSIDFFGLMFLLVFDN